MEPEVKFHSIGIIVDDIEEMDTPLPLDGNQSDRVLFVLKEGSRYQLKLSFTVLHNIVSGLTYSNRVWKGGLQGSESNSLTCSYNFLLMQFDPECAHVNLDHISYIFSLERRYHLYVDYKS